MPLTVTVPLSGQLWRLTRPGCGPRRPHEVGTCAASPGSCAPPRSRLSRAERDAGRGAFTTDAHEGGWQASAEVVVRTEPASELVAGQLQITPGEQMLVRSRVMRADGVAVQLATSYLPLAVTTPAMAESDTGPGGLYARLEETGLILARFEETVRLGQADPAEAAALEVEAGTAVLRLVRVASTEDRPVEVNHIMMLGDRFELYYDIPAR